MAGALEDAVQASIVNWIAAVAPWIVVVHVPNELMRRDNKTQMFRQKRLGTKRGAPDLIIVAHDKVMFIEVKREKGGTISKEQWEFGEAVSALGHYWLVARSIDDVRAAFKHAGVRTREWVG